MMPVPAATHAVVLTFDRFHTGFLGCYGNEWIETPHFDRLAADACVFHQHFGEDFRASAGNFSWWTGCFQFPRPSPQCRGQVSWGDALQSVGVSTHTITEAGALQPPENGFPHNVRQVVGRDGLDVPRAETPFAQLIQAGVDTLRNASLDRPTLVWLCSRGVPLPWVAPRELATLYANELESFITEEEFEAFLRTERPAGDVTRFDELEHLVARYAYAGYATMLDLWFGKLMDGIFGDRRGEQTLLIVTAASGERLQREEYGQQPLAAEVVRAPLIVRHPNSGFRNPVQSLAQTVDLLPTLLDWFGVETFQHHCEGRSLLPIVRGEQRAVRDYTCFGGDGGHRGIRTNEYCLMETSPEMDRSEASPPQLFVKPDDVWDVHDVAAQSPAEVGRLRQTLSEFVTAAQAECPMRMPALQRAE